MVRRVLAFAKWVQTKLSGRRAGYHLCRMVTPLHEPSRLATHTFFADLLRTADVWQSAERDGGGKSKGTHLPTMPCALCRQEDGPVPTRLEAFETDYPPCPQRADPFPESARCGCGVRFIHVGFLNSAAADDFAADVSTG